MSVETLQGIQGLVLIIVAAFGGYLIGLGSKDKKRNSENK